MKLYPDSNSTAVASNATNAADAAAAQTWFDQDKARRAEKTPSGQHARSLKIRQQLFKKRTSWLNAK